MYPRITPFFNFYVFTFNFNVEKVSVYIPSAPFYPELVGVCDKFCTQIKVEKNPLKCPDFRIKPLEQFRQNPPKASNFPLKYRNQEHAVN
jgi:hypothetical protein